MKASNDSSSLSAALRERLDTIDAEVAELHRRLERLVDHRTAVAAMLAAEDALADGGSVQFAAATFMGGGTFQPAAAAVSLTAGSPTLGAPRLIEHRLSDWIVKALRSRPRDIADLKHVLADAPMLKEHPSPGRAINFALVGLQRGGHVERRDDGKWALSKKEPASTE